MAKEFLAARLSMQILETYSFCKYQQIELTMAVDVGIALRRFTMIPPD
jgi:hypothetical protein